MMEMQRGRSTPSISSKVVTESTTVENAAAGSGADVTVLDYEHEDVMSEIDRTIRGEGDLHKWRRMNQREKWEFLLGDGPPVHADSRVNLQWGKIETTLYHFLSNAYKARRAFLKT